MSSFIIEGGRKLSGRIEPSGNKNEALPCIAAALLTDREVVLHNVPEIRDVHVMLDIIRRLGAEVRQLGHGSYSIQAERIATSAPDPELCARVRASILFTGPLLARTGLVELPPPGGDVIGRRRIDTHLLSLEKMGAKVEVGDRFRLQADRLRPANIMMDEQSVTATENLAMAASLAPGTTEILYAACEPHVTGLCDMLAAMGAGIEGRGTNRLLIHGRDTLAGCEHTIGPDFMEIGSLIGLAAVTGSQLTIDGTRPHELRMTLLVLEKLGIRCRIEGAAVTVLPGQELAIRDDLGGVIPKIDDAPWPGFPPDLMSIAIVVATQCRGSILFFEKMFESRMVFVDSLIGMGARIIVCDPHRIVVNGPTRLFPGTLVSPDIRAGMALLIAALCARGTTTIRNVQQIDRGYERIDQRLNGLGASIVRLEE